MAIANPFTMWREWPCVASLFSTTPPLDMRTSNMTTSKPETAVFFDEEPSSAIAPLILNPSDGSTCIGRISSTSSSRAMLEKPQLTSTSLGIAQAKDAIEIRSSGTITQTEGEEVALLMPKLSIRSELRASGADSVHVLPMKIDFAFSENVTAPPRSYAFKRKQRSRPYRLKSTRKLSRETKAGNKKFRFGNSATLLAMPTNFEFGSTSFIHPSCEVSTSSNTLLRLVKLKVLSLTTTELVSTMPMPKMSTMATLAISRQITKSAESSSVMTKNDFASTRESIGGKAMKLPACFSALPAELRLIIWNLARPDPRVIKLSLSKHSKHEDWPQRLYSGATIPNLLHVCRESQQVALEWYSPSFSLKENPRTYMEKLYAKNPIYFDLDNDYLYTSCEACRACGDCPEKFGSCGITLLRSRYKSIIKNIIFEYSGSQSVLFRPFIEFPELENFKCVDWEKGLLFRHEARVADFKEDESSYGWQHGRSLRECFESSPFKTSDEFASKFQNLKTISAVALQPFNTLEDILKDAEIRFTRKKKL